MNQAIWGALTMACWVAGLFFFRFWKPSRDRLFLFFSAAFWLLGVHWLALVIINPPVETRPYFYVLRLLAFLLIIAGIVDKNRRDGA
jgi:hypothetical protein